jgi:ubiquinone/menaquinone biosynthesis C-methylase UbiE
MAHKFDPDHMESLDRVDRKDIFSAEAALKIVGCITEDIVADIGCGTGYLSIPAAKIVGSAGRVYGFDTSDRMVGHLQQRADREGLKNLTVMQSLEYEFPIAEAFFDIAIMSSVFHEVDDRVRFAKAAAAILKTGGRLVIFEMKPGAAASGPPEHHRVPVEAAKRDLLEAGFEIAASAELNEYYYYVTGVKNY